MNREKIINALERCQSYWYCEDKDCPYFKSASCLKLLRKDILELLKVKDTTELFDSLEALRVDIDVDGFDCSDSEINTFNRMNTILDECINIIRGWLENERN